MSAPDKKWSFKKIGPYAKWWLASFAFFGILLSSAIASSYFIYLNIFRTLDDAHSIVILNSGLAINSVNMESYQQATRALELKEKTSTIPKNIRDIFSYGPETASSTPTSTKK
ncbi:MAG: hypothetical protein HY983_04030 [Candidatus Magasanikbacteria bacterium]|nr:hypothetical protein [Candidatus Magasanikbacteria bacterium]